MKSKVVPPGYLFTRRYSNYVFILLFLLYLFDYADRMVVSSMFSYIQADLGINDFQSGWLVSITISLQSDSLTFPVSLVIDRWSRTKTIGIMAIVWSLATLLCAFTGNYVQLFPRTGTHRFRRSRNMRRESALISGMYPMEEKRSKMMGLWNASDSIGSAIGVTAGGIIASSWGWKPRLRPGCHPRSPDCNSFPVREDYKDRSLQG